MCFCARLIPSSCHPRCVFDRPLDVGPRSVLLLFLSVVYLFSSTLYLCPALHLQCRQRRVLKPLRLCTRRSIAPMAIYHPLTGCEPNVLDDFHFSETSAMIFQDESGDIDTEPSCSCDAELHDETIGKALSSPLLIQEREEPANRRQA